MKKYLFVLLALFMLASLNVHAQITYRGVARKPTASKKPAAAEKKVIPKAGQKAGARAAQPATPAKAAVKKAVPAKKPVATKKPVVAKKKPVPFKPRQVKIFPKVIFPQVRADFVGFSTNIKGFVPSMVLFKLIHTNKPGVKINNYVSRIGRVVPTTSTSSKLEITTPKNMPPGYYDVYAMDAAKRTVKMASNIVVTGISSTHQTFFTNIVNGVISTFPMLTIIGHGFGVANKANYAHFDNMRLATVLTWNDSVVKIMIPYWVNTGSNYSVRIRNSKGIEIPLKSYDPYFRVNFAYKGIRTNFFNADVDKADIMKFRNLQSLASEVVAEKTPASTSSKKTTASTKSGASKSSKVASASKKPRLSSKSPTKTAATHSKKSAEKSINLGKVVHDKNNQYLTLLQIVGIGFGKEQKDSKVFLNTTECRQIVSWSDTLITLKATAFRPGKYVSKVFLNPNSRWKKNVYASRDSFYIWGRIPYKITRIVGSNYMVSLKKSELPSELVKKSASYIYTLPQDARAELAFYDASGKNMYAKIFSSDKLQTKGRYKITYNTTDLSSGKYLLVFTVNQDKYMKVFHPVVIR